MEVEFDFRREKSTMFGQISRPVARIKLIHNDMTVEEYVYVDSGADITLVPKSLGDLLGLSIGPPEEIKEIKGIGERAVPVVIKKVRLQIGEKIMPCRIAWALIEEVPLLLGRTDVFEFFDITFKKNTKTIFSE